VLLGDGAGGFGAKTDFATVNGDGRPDLAVANCGADSVSVLLGFVPTRTTLAGSPNPVGLESPLTLTATVSVPAPGYGTPADSVRFFDGMTLLGTSPVNGGAAVLVLLSPHLGERSLTEVYKDDGKLFGSISAVQTLHVVERIVAVPERAAPPAFAPNGVRPNPALGGRMMVHFTLPTGEPAKLELIDVAGRRAVGSLGAGRHAVDLAAGCRVPPGLYLLRLTQGTNTRVVRAAMLD